MHECVRSLADAYITHLSLPVWTVKGMLAWASFVYEAEDKR